MYYCVLHACNQTNKLINKQLIRMCSRYKNDFKMCVKKDISELFISHDNQTMADENFSDNKICFFSVALEMFPLYHLSDHSTNCPKTVRIFQFRHEFLFTLNFNSKQTNKKVYKVQTTICYRDTRF